MGAPKINEESEATPQLPKTHFYPFESPPISLSPDDPYQCQRDTGPSSYPIKQQVLHKSRHHPKNTKPAKYIPPQS